MGARTRLVVATALLVGLAVGLTGCMGGLFAPQQIAALLVGEPVATGGKWEVVLSVAKMPNGGLAWLEIDLGGVTYDNAKISNVEAREVNGFQVLASKFDDATGKGRFLVANAAVGVEGGVVVKLVFDANAAVSLGDITFDKSKITLGNDQNTLISVWDLLTDKVFYAK
jgi:hypothetical protein